MAYSRKIFQDQDKVGDRKHQILDLNATARVLETKPVLINSIAFDNIASATDTYLKFYDTASPTVGTTDPEIIIGPLSPTVAGTVTFKGDGRPLFNTAMTVAACTTAGTAGSTNPGAQFDVDIQVEDAA